MNSIGQIRSEYSVLRQWDLLLNRLPFLPANRAYNICVQQCHYPTRKPEGKIWWGDSLADGDAGYRGNPFEAPSDYDKFLFRVPVSIWVPLCL